MREYIDGYVKYTDKMLNENKYDKNYIEDHLQMIKFFQHERVIHLVITLFYALLTILFLVLSVINWIFAIIVVILCGFLICYIYHYFYLENHVQYMYKQYNKMKKLDLKI